MPRLNASGRVGSQGGEVLVPFAMSTNEPPASRRGNSNASLPIECSSCPNALALGGRKPSYYAKASTAVQGAFTTIAGAMVTEGVFVQGFRVNATGPGWSTITFPVAFRTANVPSVTVSVELDTTSTTLCRTRNHTNTTVDVYVNVSCVVNVTAIGRKAD